MSSLDETRSRVRDPFAGIVGRHMLYRLLALLTTGLLIIWVSGGLLAQPLQYFLQACVHFSQLRAAWGMEFLLSFALLLVQSLLLVASWVLYLWIVVREIRHGSVSRARSEIDAASIVGTPTPEKAPALDAGEMHAAHGWQEVKTVVVSNPFEDDVAAVETLVLPPSSFVEEPGTKRRTQPAVSYDERTREIRPVSFAKIEEPPTLVPGMQERGLGALKKTKLRRNPMGREEAPTSSPASRIKQEEEPSSPHLVPSSPQPSGEMEALNPFYEPEAGAELIHFSSVLREMGFFQIGQQESSREGSAQGEQRENINQAESRSEGQETKEPAPEANPFGVHADILELFAPTKPAEVEKQPSAVLPSPAELPPDQLYVYGNPFEGPLPDIFHHDESLKSSVLEQVAEELEERSEKRPKASERKAVEGDGKRQGKRRTQF